ncbi:hypothetical protein AAT1_02041 [Pseudomonas phage AAT-1]|uniref:Uncharacterized protein n=1 Tax=Pseudomonas phage AAT-1 TaxID=1775248 RepID=A0A125SA71_9CAUD|nr:hypothetical protein P9A56_gp41 [Pseudomonas phage AAT-1]AME18067.1 hypothetical protein AAT1_02041 [Pseudomonas phage AAT-1]
MKIADIIRRGIALGSTTDEILEAVRSIHPTAKTNASCVAYYRSKEKKAGGKEGSVSRAIHKALYPASGHPTYTVKGVKTFVGMEGYGYNGSLYRDGKLVAFVIDDASGGPLQIEWKDVSDGLVEVETKDYKGNPWVAKMTNEEKALHEHATSLPPSVCDWIDPDTGRPAELSMTSELFIEGLVNDALLLKDVAKMTRGKVAFVRDGKLYTVKCEPTAANVAKVKERNPGAVVLNGMDDPAMLAAVRAVK